MSIATMVRLSVERDEQRAETSPAAAAGSDEGENAVKSAMERIAAFIPSEAIAIYVAGFGILTPDTSTAKWTIFGVALVLIPIFIWLNYVTENRKRRRTGKAKVRTVWLIVLFAVVAYVAWAAAMPGTPFLELSDDATRIGGFVVVIAAALMYKAGEVLGIVPNADQAATR